MIDVTVVIPTYNAAGVLERTLGSVRAQEGDFRVETIVCDDGSTDETAVLARRLGARVIESDRNSGGPNRGRNAGLEAAGGEWICLLDQDDAFLPGKIQRQLDLNVPISWTGYEVVDEGGGPAETRGVRGGAPVLHEANAAFRRWLRRERAGAPYLSTLMIHRSLAGVRFEEHFGVVDYDYLLRLLEHQHTGYVREPLMRRHTAETSLSLDERYRRIDYYYSLYALEAYENAYPSDVTVARQRINGSRARYFYRKGDMKRARRYFLRARPALKTLGYLATSFAGASLVRRRFRVFG